MTELILQLFKHYHSLLTHRDKHSNYTWAQNWVTSQISSIKPKTHWKILAIRSLYVTLCDMDLPWTTRLHIPLIHITIYWVPVHCFSFFVHLIVFCTSYCFALFFISLHILLLFLFFLPYVCPCVMLLYIICIVIILHCPLSGPDSIRLHFTSNYTLYNYYVTNKETLNLDLINLAMTCV